MNSSTANLRRFLRQGCEQCRCNRPDVDQVDDDEIGGRNTKSMREFDDIVIGAKAADVTLLGFSDQNAG